MGEEKTALISDKSPDGLKGPWGIILESLLSLIYFERISPSTSAGGVPGGRLPVFLPELALLPLAVIVARSAAVHLSLSWTFGWGPGGRMVDGRLRDAQADVIKASSYGMELKY